MEVIEVVAAVVKDEGGDDIGGGDESCNCVVMQ